MGFSTVETNTSTSSSSPSSTTTSTLSNVSLLQCSSDGAQNQVAPLQTEEEAEPPEENNISKSDSIINPVLRNLQDLSMIREESQSNSENSKEEIGEAGMFRPITFDSPSFSYMNPKIRCTRSPNGVGLFAIKTIDKDELLLGWSGKVVHVSEILAMPETERTYILQIDENLFQVPFWKGYNEPADFVNHSCKPNAGFGDSPIALVAMRQIQIGEEIAFDYAMCESVEGLVGNEFECSCGVEECRGAFTGADWKNPKLWSRYGRYFAPHIRKKIKKLKKQMMLDEKQEQTSIKDTNAQDSITRATYTV